MNFFFCRTWLLFIQINQVFNVAFRSFDGREIQSHHTQTICHCIVRDHKNHFFMYSNVFDNTILPYFFSSCFKLRFNEADQLSILFHNTQYGRQNFCQGNKRYVNGRKIRRIRHLFLRYIAHIGFFQTNDSGVIAQFPGKLTIANVDGIYLCSAVLQHTVCETAGGSANIQTDFICQCNGKNFHGFFQFIAAAADIFHGCIPHFDFRSYRNLCAGFIFFHAVHIDIACHNICFRLISARCQPTLYQQYI